MDTLADLKAVHILLVVQGCLTELVRLHEEHFRGLTQSVALFDVDNDLTATEPVPNHHLLEGDPGLVFVGPLQQVKKRVSPDLLVDRGLIPFVGGPLQLPFDLGKVFLDATDRDLNQEAMVISPKPIGFIIDRPAVLIDELKPLRQGPPTQGQTRIKELLNKLACGPAQGVKL